MHLRTAHTHVSIQPQDHPWEKRCLRMVTSGGAATVVAD